MEQLRFPLMITWTITDNCNLRCKHCFKKEYKNEYLDLKIINQLINLFKKHNVYGIILTGGEPLTSKYLFDILKEINHQIKVGIATNGVLLDKELITRLKNYGVKSFQVSLEGTTKEINDYIRGEGVYEKVLKNINLLLKENFDVTVAMTVNEYNYEDIKSNSLDFVKAIGVPKLRLEYYIPIDENKKMLNPITNEMMDDLCKELLSKNTDIILQYPNFDNNVGCGAGIFNCVINSDLSLSPCDLLTHKFRSNQMKTIEDFEKIWNYDESFIEWRKIMKCYNCNKKYKCVAMGERNE